MTLWPTPSFASSLLHERAEVNVPIGDEMAARFSIKFDHEASTCADLAIPGFRLDDQHDTSGKAALLW